MIRKHCSRAVLNKASLISNIRFSRYTNSHKHKHIQPFFFSPFGHIQHIRRAKDFIRGVSTSRLVLTAV